LRTIGLNLDGWKVVDTQMQRGVMIAALFSKGSEMIAVIY
jgi:hypothetical protein